MYSNIAHNQIEKTVEAYDEVSFDLTHMERVVDGRTLRSRWIC